jgi:transposase
MKSYSNDLRQKIIETKLETQESDREVAQRFRVSRSFVHKLLRQYQRLGNFEPLPHGGGASLKLSQAEIEAVIQLIAENRATTLEQLKACLAEKKGIDVSVSTLSRLLRRFKVAL